MQLTKEAVAGVVDVYIRAWVGQDPDLITTVFTEDATYHERVMDDPVILGHDGIRAYWRSKVVESQAHISCQLLSLYLDGTTAIAEWEAEFDRPTAHRNCTQQRRDGTVYRPAPPSRDAVPWRLHGTAPRRAVAVRRYGVTVPYHVPHVCSH